MTTVARYSNLLFSNYQAIKINITTYAPTYIAKTIAILDILCSLYIRIVIYFVHALDEIRFKKGSKVIVSGEPFIEV